MSSSFPQQPHPDKPFKTVEQIFAEFRNGIPKEEYQKLPDDGSIQHDHYIYGTPKQTET